MKKPTIQIKTYTHNGNYVITTENAVGAVKSILIDLAPSFYPNGERAYPSIRTDVLGFNEQVEAIAGWCQRGLKTCIKGEQFEKRLTKALNDCIALMSKMQSTAHRINVSRRHAA